MEILSRIIQVSLASEVELHGTGSVTDTLAPEDAEEVASAKYNEQPKNAFKPPVEPQYKKIQRFVPSRSRQRFRTTKSVSHAGTPNP